MVKREKIIRAFTGDISLVYGTTLYFFLLKKDIVEEQLQGSVNILLIYYIIIAILVGTLAPIVLLICKYF
jgi:Mg/Co/Ni transporter MgtE